MMVIKSPTSLRPIADYFELVADHSSISGLDIADLLATKCKSIDKHTHQGLIGDRLVAMPVVKK